ncbi:hypothetical protein P4310_24840 [Bacillus thuringiensis]|uniref:Stage III sporulation protein AE n=1 Tax=Bacillus cereus TIAC219 TaxID=718222 RepID=A0ABC9SP29_BACCE|nr:MULTISPECIES: hypothetical protein [Bacillus cereus group]MDA2074593.1 hypothetical protein [Bacillus cereus]EJP81007.1 hypothetical protein IC1_06733 [Bacillus cereus VD022]EOQ55265.1 hypothetical protein IAY_06787 [Bacillus cereus TIAC219]MDA2440846.1 hypothetical protein [Bacillus cereus]MDA2446816.1 hypothetical protein [Bacillus cereus]
MGVIGGAFKKLFGLLWDCIKWIGEFIYNLFQPFIDAILNVIQVFLDILDAILYFFYMVGVVIVKVFTLIFQTAKLLWSLVVGFGKTLASLQFTPGSSGHGYSAMIGKVFGIAESMQLNSVAYIMLFILWFFTAISAMKLISSIRVGGD